jgi:glycosyltransferase involved in cell wall biosynthesis
MNVGLYFNARRSQGGLYQYAVSLVQALADHDSRHRYTLWLATPDPPHLRLPAHFRVESVPRPALLARLGVEAALMQAARRGLPFTLPVLPRHLGMLGRPCDAMLYVKPSLQSFLWPYPAVFPIHDLQHVLQPEFPEVSAGGETARREYVYRRAVPAARAILADSEVGREDVLRIYRPDPARVHALSYFPPPGILEAAGPAHQARVRERYSLPERFFFYPAAFWRHKNHAALVRALALLDREHGLRVPLVLAGGLRHEQPAVARLAAELGVTWIRFLGYVPDEDVYPLYALALALVMPTFFGPTNLPNLEAWTLGCPLVTSDLRGLREHVGDAGLLVDPRSPEALARAMQRLATDPGLREDLAARGRRRVAGWGPQPFAEKLSEILSGCA